MISTFKTFSVDKAFYTGLTKYVRSLGSSFILLIATAFLSIPMSGLGLSFYGLYTLLLTSRLGITTIYTIKAIFFTASIIGFFILFGGLIAGIVQVALDLYRTGSARISTVFSRFHNAIQIVLFILLWIIMGTFGLLLLIVPGFIVLLRTRLAFYFIVDQNMNAIEAIKASWRATRGNVLKISVVSFICALMNFYFLLLAMPLYWFVETYIYEALSGHNSETSKSIPQ